MYSMLFHSLFPKERFFKHMVSGTSLLRKTQINTNTNTANDTFLKIIHVYHVIFKNTNMLHRLSDDREAKLDTVGKSFFRTNPRQMPHR